jgi:hypothetical protein
MARPRSTVLEVPRRAKEKLYYYECVTTCQMGYMAPDQRRERWSDEMGREQCLHERSFYPAGLGKKRPDYLATREPISKRYTQEIDRKFRKRNLQTGKWQWVHSPTNIKFYELAPDEIGDYVREHAHFLALRDCDLAKTDKEGIIEQKPATSDIIEEEVDAAQEG